MANLIDARWRVVFLCAAVAVVTTVPAQADCADGGAPLTPSVSIVHNGTTPNGLASFTISYSFPGTNHSWERGLRWLDEGQVIGHLSTDQGSGSVTPGQIIVACRTLGNHTFSAQAWTACNFQQSPTVTSSVNVYTDNTPATSLSASEPDASGVVTATLSYAFPNTFDERFRQIWLDIDGSVESTGGLQLQGTWVRSFSTTCKPNGIHYLYASVTACGGMPSSASASTSDSYTVNHKPTVTIGFDEKPEGTYAVSTFNFPQTTAPSQRLLELRRSHSNALIASTNPGAQSGTWRVLMTCDPGVPVYATAKACSDTPVKSGDAMPPKCELSCKVPTETPSSSCCIGDPVHANSGNMEFSDRDPLPGGMVAPLQRTYQSRNPAAGAFGTGWTTIMDARAIATGGTDGRDGVFLTLEDGRRVMFRRSGGVYAQTYPADSSTAGTLSFDAGRNGFLHRDAGSILSRIFRASDGRLVALVDVRGDEVVLTYDGNGKATSVADEAGRWSWSISYGTGGLIQSIAVDGQPGLTWTYGYTGTKLTTVTAPGSAVWRTYVYGSAGLVEIRDARGAVTERHEYDSAGRARSSFGPSGEFTDIQFNLAGRVTASPAHAWFQQTGNQPTITLASSPEECERWR
jgi:YD repeat-containing protein